jgi:hypothetical protein
VLEEFRAQLIEHPEVIDVAVVEERLRSGRSTEDSTAGAEEGMSWGPLLLGAAGAGLLGAAAYGVFGESCSVTSTRNGCLVGNETDMLPVSVYGGAGVVALTTALIWALSGPDDVESESAVRVGVGRLGVSVVGHF